jgi:hypothetical protein
MRETAADIGRRLRPRRLAAASTITRRTPIPPTPHPEQQPLLPRPVNKFRVERMQPTTCSPSAKQQAIVFATSITVYTDAASVGRPLGAHHGVLLFHAPAGPVWVRPMTENAVRATGSQQHCML